MATDAPPATAPPATSAPEDPARDDSLPLPPLVTSPLQQGSLPRPMSHASKSRLSQYSASSVPSRSRPPSHVFPMFPSSLSYALVRDFAYPAMHPLHYGPPPEPSGPPSGWTTPASEHRRLSDPPASWEPRMPWDSWSAEGFNRGHDVPPISFGDGPPYSEDEDLQSPVVSTRHRKHKSTSAALGRGSMDSTGFEGERPYYVGAGRDGGERYYLDHGGEANGPGGEVVTYHPGDSRHSRASYYYNQPPELGRDVYVPSEYSSNPSSPNHHDDSRYSRDYQFTITSPDEEFHGKAVALFDFARENENELPLVEGQIIWVSYRHGQGWLVAEDPKTQESGLVPEEYVRLLRDIEGGMNSLTGQIGDGSASPDVGTPTQPDIGGAGGQSLPGGLAGQAGQGGQGTPAGVSGNSAANGYHQPIVSMFSTSSKDLNPYPTGQLGIQGAAGPPQVIHYHGQRGSSQANTPTLSQPDSSLPRRESQDPGVADDAADAAAAGELGSETTDAAVADR